MNNLSLGFATCFSLLLYEAMIADAFGTFSLAKHPVPQRRRVQTHSVWSEFAAEHFSVFHHPVEIIHRPLEGHLGN